MLHGDMSPYEPILRDRQAADSGPAQSGVSPFSSGSLLFPELKTEAIALLPAADNAAAVARTKQALAEISEAMVGPTDIDEALGPIPAGFTYFGQFVFHDIVFSRVFGLPEGMGASHHLKNGVSEGLDLSGLYGRGTAVDAHLYDAPIGEDRGVCHFPLGLPCREGTKLPVDADEEKGRDLPRIDMSSNFIAANGRRAVYRPLVADPRNDDNLILSQLLSTLMRVHNRLVDVQLAAHRCDADTAHRNARIFLVNAYRDIVVNDYMKRILAPEIWAHFFDGEDFRGVGVDGLPQLTNLPVEFTFGASRFAHAMVRQFYRVNKTFEEQPGSLQKLLSFSSLRPDGDVPVPANWMVDWSRFVGDEDTPALQHARRISPFLSSELASPGLTGDGSGPRSVAFMDCWRCYDIGLPSGQTVAKALAQKMVGWTGIHVRALTPDEMLPTPACSARFVYHSAKLRAAIEKAPEFKSETPLSYYILQEAAVLGEDGKRLGPVGSYIVASTIAAALFQSANTDVRPNRLVSGMAPITLAKLLTLHEPSRIGDADLLALIAV